MKINNVNLRQKNFFNCSFAHCSGVSITIAQNISYITQNI